MTPYTKEDALLDALRAYAETLQDVESFFITYYKGLDVVRMYFSMARHNILIERPMTWLQALDEQSDIENWLYNQIGELIDECED